MKTETEPTIDLPPAPPIVEIALYEGDPDPAAGYVIQSADDRIPGSYTGPDNPEGWYILLRRETMVNGDEYVWLDRGHALAEDDSFFAPPVKPKPFRVVASKIKRIRKRTWYSHEWLHPLGSRLDRQDWRIWATNHFGPEAVDAELARIAGLGPTDEERAAVWNAERQAFNEAGVIPA